MVEITHDSELAAWRAYRDGQRAAELATWRAERDANRKAELAAWRAQRAEGRAAELAAVKALRDAKSREANTERAVTKIFDLRQARQSGTLTPREAAQRRFDRAMRKLAKSKPGTVAFDAQAARAQNALGAMQQIIRARAAR